MPSECNSTLVAQGGPDALCYPWLSDDKQRHICASVPNAKHFVLGENLYKTQARGDFMQAAHCDSHESEQAFYARTTYAKAPSNGAPV